MSLTRNIAKQFAAITNDSKSNNVSDNTVFGTVVEKNGEASYVRIDGSDRDTPISTTAKVKAGDRVVVTLKNHTATIIGNTTDPSASSTKVTEIDGEVSKFNEIVADKITVEELNAAIANVEELFADYASIEYLDANYANIEELNAKYATIENLEAKYATIENLEANYATIAHLEAKYATIENLEADYATIEELEADYATIEELEANYATIKKLEAEYATIATLHADYATIKKLEAEYATIVKLEADYASIEYLRANYATAETLIATYATIKDLTAANAKIAFLEGDYASISALDAKIAEVNELFADYATITELQATNANIESLGTKYANIDFANIGEAAIRKLYAETGLIDDLVISGGKVTGKLAAVTIDGDLINAGTLKADTLILKGKDGLYYQLNAGVDGVTEAQLATEEYQNALHGSNIIAHTITATEISVDDLVAFDATIGGFTISNSAIYSGAKTSAVNTTAGVYFDSTGQMAFGDNNNYVRYYKDSSNKHKLEIIADSLSIRTGDNVTSVGGLASRVDSAETAISQNSEAIELKASKTDVETSISGVNKKITDAETSIKANADAIALRATKTEVNTLTGRVTDAEAAISVNAGNIALKAAQSEVNAISGRLGTAESNISQNADAIALRATKSEVDTIAGRVTDAEAAIEVNAGNINLKATQEEVNAISGRLGTAESNISQNANAITSRVTKTDFDKGIKNVDDKVAGLTTRVSTAESNITQNASAIALRVTQTDYDTGIKNVNDKVSGLTTRVSTAESSITQNANAIALRVTKEEFDALDVGGCNLLQNTKTMSGYSFGSVITSVDTNGFTVASFASTSSLAERSFVILPRISYSTVRDRQVTLSFYAKSDEYEALNSNTSQGLFISFTLCAGDSTTIVKHRPVYFYESKLSNKWSKLSTTVTLSDSFFTQGSGSIDDSTRFYIRVFHYSLYKVDTKKFQLEFGNKATDWSPAPEDVEKAIGANTTLIEQTNKDILLKANQTQVDDINQRLTETEAEIRVGPNSIVSKVTSLENLEIGGRNLLENSSFKENYDQWSLSNGGTTEFVEKYGRACMHINLSVLETQTTIRQNILHKLESNTTYTMSAWVLTENITKGTKNFFCSLYTAGHYPLNGESTWFDIGSITIPVNTGTGKWTRVTKQFKTDVTKFTTATDLRMYVYARDFTGDLYFADLKLEKGDKATDWTPAPEDNASQSALSKLRAEYDVTAGEASTALTEITQLSNQIATLVVGENGGSLMTQTENGWSFNISTIQENIGSVADDLDDLGQQVGGLGDDLDKLNESTDQILAYVNITTSDGEPCIELGKDSEEEGEDEFKVVITNTQIQFKKNDETPAYINNESMYIDTADIENELRFGDFAWKKRSNGNMGLMWKG